MKIGIKYIAAKAGVSPATVSRVMNGTKNVKPEIKEKVLQTVRKYEYRPNCMARALVLKKSKLIGVMAPNVSNYFHSAVISAIEAVAADRGYGVIISNTNGNFASQLKNLRSLSEHQIDGLLLLHENSEEEMIEISKNTWVPIVTASITIPNFSLPSVGIDEEKAAFEATKYLIELGHRNIGGIFGNCYTLAQLRKNGFEKALASAGIVLKKEWTASADCTIESGRQACLNIFSGGSHPTALFCISDEIAIGCVDYLRSAGFCVPKDVSVVGFDDIQLAGVFSPKLTTVRQPITEIGRAGAKLLLDIIDGKVVSQPHIVLQSKLIVRESAAPVSK